MTSFDFAIVVFMRNATITWGWDLASGYNFGSLPSCYENVRTGIEIAMKSIDLVDDKVLQGQAIVSDIVAKLRQMIMDVDNDVLRGGSGKDLLQNISARSHQHVYDG